jgi:hypothetical protein
MQASSFCRCDTICKHPVPGLPFSSPPTAAAARSSAPPPRGRVRAAQVADLVTATFRSTAASEQMCGRSSTIHQPRHIYSIHPSTHTYIYTASIHLSIHRTNHPSANHPSTSSISKSSIHPSIPPSIYPSKKNTNREEDAHRGVGQGGGGARLRWRPAAAELPTAAVALGQGRTARAQWRPSPTPRHWRRRDGDAVEAEPDGGAVEAGTGGGGAVEAGTGDGGAVEAGTGGGGEDLARSGERVRAGGVRCAACFFFKWSALLCACAVGRPGGSGVGFFFLSLLCRQDSNDQDGKACNLPSALRKL